MNNKINSNIIFYLFNKNRKKVHNECGCVFQMCKHEDIYSMSSNIRAKVSDVSPEKRNISFGSTKNETSLQETNVIFEMEK